MKKRILGILAIAFMVIPLLLSGLSVKAEETETKTEIARTTYAESTVNLTIHALQYKQTDEDGDVNNGKGQHAIPNQQNTGSEMIVGEKGDFTGTPISGVTFDIYDITDFYKEGNNGVTASAIQRAVYNKTSLNGTTGSLVYDQSNLKETTNQTKDNGQVETNTLHVVENNLFTAYLIVQKDSGKDTLNKAYPMVVTLPVFTRDGNGNNTSDGTLLTNIHLYPKMEAGSIFGEPTDPKTPTDPNDPKYPIDPKDPSNPKNPVNDPDYVGNAGVRQSVDYNQTVTYGFNLTIPRGTLTNSTDYSITIRNKLDSNNTETSYLTNPKDIELYAKEKKIDESLYTVSNDGKTITFKASTNYQSNLEGKIITVIFNSKLNENAPLDTDFTKVVSGTTKDGDPASFDLKSVYTGGSHFKVIDSNASNATTDYKQFITNSRFYITKEINKETYYARVTTSQQTENNSQQDENTLSTQFLDQKNTKAYTFLGWEKLTSQTPDTEDIMDFKVDDTDITGMNKRLSTTFSVQGLKNDTYQVQQIKSHDLYVNPNTTVLKFNVDGGSTKEMQSKDTTTFAETKALENYNVIKNVKKGFLPSTGGTGIFIFLVVGIALMGGSYIWFKRSKDSAEV